MGVILEGEETIEQLLQQILFSGDFPEQQVTIKGVETRLEITGFRLGVRRWGWGAGIQSDDNIKMLERWNWEQHWHLRFNKLRVSYVSRGK